MAEPVRELLSPRTVKLGESTEVRRLLPNLGRRMVGAWCFVDHYGPDDIAGEPGMQVAPHPHTGLQTVSWLHDGEVLHRDSVGSLETIRPRELGLMTSGRGISHSEESPRSHGRVLHGAQLWVALPEVHRNVDPHFQHHAQLPQVTAPGLTATVILGTLDTATSPGTAYSPIVGADLALAAGTETRLPLDPDFEYAVLSMSGKPTWTASRSSRARCSTSAAAARNSPARDVGRGPDAPGRRAVRGGDRDVLELDRTVTR